MIVPKSIEKYSYAASLQAESLAGRTTTPSIPSANAFGITFETWSWMAATGAEARWFFTFWFYAGKFFPATFTDSSKNFLITQK